MTAANAQVEAISADACYRCGYELRGIADDQPCPECGLLAERSRRESDELHHTRPGWLKRLSAGVWLILLAIVVGALAPALLAGSASVRSRMAVGIGGTSPVAYAVYMHVGWFGVDVAALLLLGGVLLVTSREGYAPADQADARRRRLIRLLAVVPLIAVALLHVDAQLAAGALWSRRPRSWGPPEGSYTFAAFVLATIGCSPLPLLLYLQLRSLAKRARSAHLAEHCLIVGTGNALTLLYIPAFAFVFKNAERWGLGHTWTTRSNVSLVLLLAVFVSAILFGMWNLYLLIRFAVAFAAASRKLRKAWHLADRSDPFGADRPAY